MNGASEETRKAESLVNYFHYIVLLGKQGQFFSVEAGNVLIKEGQAISACPCVLVAFLKKLTLY